MFTVLNRMANGCDVFFEAIEVCKRVVNARGEENAAPNDKKHVEIYVSLSNGDHVHLPIPDARDPQAPGDTPSVREMCVIIMNANGKTVGKYGPLLDFPV